MLALDKAGFRARTITGNKEAFYIMIMIERSIHEENIIILSAFATYNRTPKHIEQKLVELKGEIQNSTIILEDVFQVKTRQKINKDIKAVNIINQLDVTDVYRTRHPRAAIWWGPLPGSQIAVSHVVEGAGDSLGSLL